jgi:hypothetical protein
MKAKHLISGVLLAVSLAACTETPSTGPAPTPATMSFKQGARYEFSSYHTDPQTSQKQDTSQRRRVWTLASNNASVYGQTGVAVYVDSVFGVGGILSVMDSVYLQQRTGNDIYRYASLAPEFDVSGVALFDLGKQWMHEARLNATVASWDVGELSDTLPLSTFGVSIPGVQYATIGISDHVDSSMVENLTIAGRTLVTTKTVHRLSLGLKLYVSILGTLTPIDVPLDGLYRRTWVSPELGTIVKEDREAKVLSASYTGSSFTIPVPGYHSELTAILAAGQ